jgi:hypothetical protein
MPGLLEYRLSRIAGPVVTFLSLFLHFGDDDVLGVLRVQDDGDEARLVLVAGVPADAVQAAGRLVEGVTGRTYPNAGPGWRCAASTWPGASVTSTIVAFAFFPSSFSMMSFWESSLT